MMPWWPTVRHLNRARSLIKFIVNKDGHGDDGTGGQICESGPTEGLVAPEVANAGNGGRRTEEVRDGGVGGGEVGGDGGGGYGRGWRGGGDEEGGG